VTPLADRPWARLPPSAAFEILADFPGRWWISGGWAIDLFLGRITRQHADLDVELFDRDQLLVQRHLAGWQLWQAGGGRLTPWQPGRTLRGDAHQVWCRRGAEAPWAFELQFTPGGGHEWVFRRNPAIRRRLTDVLRTDARGLVYLAPEVQLLYKAKEGRARDEADFRAALPALSRDARRWLAAALAVVHPGHPWQGPLRG
jgi:hypothetical protein